jgi:DNA processing protein
MTLVQGKISELSSMKSYPSQLYFDGNIELLKKIKVSIVGSRKPSKYSRQIVQKLASYLSKSGVCVVSGGAMGIDAVAHSSAGTSNTISVLPCGIDARYPAINNNLLNDIQKNGLLLSQFDIGFKATPWSFVVRNELVVALGDVLVVGEAELDSGTMRSVEFALKMGKKIYVLPQRIGESEATNQLLKDKKVQAIYDIDEFVTQFSTCTNIHVEDKKDIFYEFCTTNPTYDDVLKKFPDRVFEAELNGEIEIVNGRVLPSL